MDEKEADGLLAAANSAVNRLMLEKTPAKLEGVYSAPPSTGEDFERRMLRFSQRGSLSAQADEYIYFTHGLLFTHGYWPSDPIGDHIRATAATELCEPFGVNLPMPAFKWFDGKDQKTGAILDPRWNSQVCAVARAQWPPLRKFLEEIGGRNNDTKTYSTLILQQIPIVDTVALSRMATLPEKLPMFMCNCFALSTNRRLVCFAPEMRKMLWEPIPVMIRNAESSVVKYAKAIFKDAPKPMAGTVEPTEEEAKVSLAEGVLLDMRLKPSEVPKNV